MNEKLHLIQHRHAKQLKKYSALNMFSCQQPPTSEPSEPLSDTTLITMNTNTALYFDSVPQTQILTTAPNADWFTAEKKKRQGWILFTWHLTERYGASWLISVKITDSAWMPETGCPKSNVSLYFKKTKHQNICTVTLCSKPADIHSARCILLLTWPRWAQREIFTSSLDFQPTLTA